MVNSIRDIKRIYVHTAASGVVRPKHLTVEQIRDYHVMSLGWSDIGYHRYIEKDGTIKAGRDLETPGAGVRGDNANALHVCVSGHGDLVPFNDAQMKSLVGLLVRWIKHYKLTSAFRANPVRVVAGHREANALIEQGLLSRAYRTSKSCPGRKVDMRDIRTRVFKELA